jgi:hypothetical protein
MQNPQTLFLQALNKNDIQTAKFLLDEMMKTYPNVGQAHKKIRNKIIDIALENQSIDVLKLTFHPFCHGNRIDKLNDNRDYILKIVIEQQAYDFIEPCILSGFINLPNLTYEMIKRQDNKLCDYINAQPRLNFDYIMLATNFHELFTSNEGVRLAEKLDQNIHIDRDLIKKCVKESVINHCAVGLDYLMKSHCDETKEVLTQWLEFINKDEDDRREYQDLDFLVLVNFGPDLEKDLFETYKSFKHHLGLKNEENVILYFLSHHFSYLNNPTKQTYDFLQNVYDLDNELIPDSIIEAIQKTRREFKELDIYHQKTRLESIISEGNIEQKKIKI